MDLSERIEAFAQLGDYLKDALPVKEGPTDTGLQDAVAEAEIANPWFTGPFIHHALVEISRILDRSLLEEWTGRYPPENFASGTPKLVGTILAGNIPLVGFHDFLSVLLSGHRFKGKMSGKDDKLLPFITGKLVEIEPRFSGFIQIEEKEIGTIDAMIATGSNNSFRYFDYYFGKYPHIFRKNRNGAAILDGSESAEELSSLADDMLLYFGMGCRNVAKLFVPENYSFDALYEGLEKFRHLSDHHKYANNYQYQRSVFLMNNIKHLDNGFLIMRQDRSISSPVGTLHYDLYHDLSSLIPSLRDQQDSIQCIAAGNRIRKVIESPGIQGFSAIPFGSTQYPEPWEYADNVDTLNFLSNL